jgi:UDP-GlcNAc3NAcA epimerase
MGAAHARTIRTVSIVGARPQFIKLAPVSRAMKRAPLHIEDRIVHTGQHYDEGMSKVFFDDLDIPAPDVNCGVGSGPQGRQTGRMLEAVEAYLQGTHPDVVIVYGDTNSTLAGALAAAKLHIPVAHVEAGLRSFNRRMPEELNRIATDHLSELLCAPTASAIKNLSAEGLHDRALLTGDVMYDAVLFNAEVARQHSHILQDLKLVAGDYAIATIHRAENTSCAHLQALLVALNAAAARFGRIIFPMHPRTAAVLQQELPEWRAHANLTVVAPLGYLEMLALLQSANCVLTDSGGLQKEAFFLHVPCITLRDETEWTETLQDGANFIAGADGARLLQALETLRASPQRGSAPSSSPDAAPFGSGKAAERIVAAICELGESRL